MIYDKSKLINKTYHINRDCHCEECASTTKQSTAGYLQRIAARPAVARNDIKCVAFTLAEVLITLTIIGVIAALTIPNLMQTWKKHERISQIKTAYSIIQNATKMAVAEHGNSDGWDFNASWGYTPKYFLPYVKIQKSCGVKTHADRILGKGCFIDNDSWYSLKGTSYDSAHSGGYNSLYFYTIILQNSMHVGVWAPAKVYQVAPYNQRFIVFFVDVNGKQGPTTLGKDIFTFRYNLDTGKFSTGGDSANYNQNDCTLTGLGTSCAYWIERNHWEFPDNYPVKKF